MDVGELARQIEYKVAPEPLIAVQGLANTFDFDADEERLLDPDSARRWMIESDLATEDVRVGEDEWRRLLECRDVIRDLIDANLTGDIGLAAQRLGELAASHPARLVADDDGRVGLDLSPSRTVDELISQLVGIVFESQLVDTWPRLKICASDECRWAFYDNSKNRSGTWCQMAECGNRIKNRAYRERLAARERAARTAR
jgi:predicted RNA-binding Zn ribbon-like protein